MRRSLAMLLMVLTLEAFAESEAPDGEGAVSERSAYGAAPYAPCGVCHGNDGQGIPSAFPPVRNRAAAIAALDGGREYLTIAITYGLMGAIEVDGTSYSSFMPGQNGMLQPEAIAGALNYMVFELVDEPPDAAIEPFTEEEVRQYQERQSAPNLNTAMALREQLVGEHGEQWP